MTDRAIRTFAEQAARYDDARRRLIPPFDAFYGTAVEAAGSTGDVERLLDLGAGTGLLSQALRKAHPQAHLTLLDGAREMLARAREALGTEDAAYLAQDLRDPLPAGPFDTVASALAIHHLDDAGKRDLFARIRDVLRPGGVFVNAEQVLGSTPQLEQRYTDWHERRARAAGSDDAEWAGAIERMRHDRCATVEDQLEWLR